jgi:hypothetical protein
MTAEQRQLAIAAGLLVLGFFLGRQHALAKATGAAAHNDTAGAPEEWWSYAGSWAS